ncbi:dynamin family protein [Gallibacterium melopsittaci]|uniref:Dynamin family protein n=1 Tax=Gallibacterium melopsittaci TaxID=516063 RepID=A0ABV6HZ94_9PAST
MNKNLFEVIVVGTMSAGKSTMLNALIGKELLHSANEATTATITRIHDKDGENKFSGAAYNYENELIEKSRSIDFEVLKHWNTDPEIKLIEITGDIKTIYNTEAELVIYDLPGPNNSQDDNHENLTMEVIDNNEYGLIFYVLNATQIGVNDDRSLLEKIKNSLQKDNHKDIVFVLNKADQLDEEKGESLSAAIKNVEKYLTNIGFEQPKIIATSANMALLLQKLINQEDLSRRENMQISVCDFKTLSNLSESELLSINNFINESCQEYLVEENTSPEDKRTLQEKYYQMGFGAICYFLQKEINHYNHLAAESVSLDKLKVFIGQLIMYYLKKSTMI